MCLKKSWSTNYCHHHPYHHYYHTNDVFKLWSQCGNCQRYGGGFDPLVPVIRLSWGLDITPVVRIYRKFCFAQLR